ncbi:hypothetical protein GQ53DRAFT_763766 [Thozetella sp. PMI_491]|nr:hypothetical protein GQ53DRAFT_763766 [Thozetella sp. PMI_491]
MAAFFNIFRTSDMPKRLVSYALSRLELLDPESLDTDNLVLKLGSKSEAEFTNVAIIPQKLEKLLQLPPTCTIQKAKILKLKVHIPLDFYTSPIIIDVDGVDVRLRVQSKEDDRRKRRKPRDDTPSVPTAADLAQSFLATQPVAEKRELEEALAAETQDLGASVAMSDSGSEEDLAVGTGQTLSLPDFFTDLLQGIVDRTQIRIRGVNFKLDVAVPLESHTSAPELVTFHLSVDSIAVEGVTTQSLEESRPWMVQKDGKRHISLNNIRAFLISEANVFSNFARSPSMRSSEPSQSPTMGSSGPPSRQMSNLAMSMASERSGYSDPVSQTHDPLQDSEDALNIPYDLSQPDEDDGGQDEAQSPNSTPRASVYGSPSPSLHAQSMLMEPEPAPWASYSREARSEPFLDPSEGFPAHPRTPSPSLSQRSSSSSRSGHLGQEDLAQSRLYTAEEAESMYMSAYSQAQSSRMPGSWDADDQDINDSPPRHYHGSQSLPSPTPPSPPLEAQEDLLAEAMQGSILSSSVSSRSPRDELRDPMQPDPEPPASPQVPIEEVAELPEPIDLEESEPPQDDVPTPRGPPRLVKEILSLPYISAYLPSKHKHIKVSSPQLAKSTPHIPGAFSIYSSAPSEASTSPRLDPVPKSSADDKSIEIILAPTEVRFDASIGFLLAMVVSQLLDALKSQTDAAPRATEPRSGSPSSVPEITVSVESLSLLFLEKLAGVADTPERVLSPHTVDFGPDVLLKACFKNLTGSISQVESQIKTNIDIEKFTFGYADEDILSFNPQIKMYESTLSVYPQTGKDISIRVSSTSDDTRCEVDTLPLHTKLDLQRLDETFSWFGGLSSFLNMGTSIASSSPKAAMTSPVRPAAKPRGVRFEAPINPNDKSASKENKVNLRVNGFRLDVFGKECDLVVETSAIKLVKREEAIGVHFSKLRLSGPFINSSSAAPAIVAEISNTRLEYLLLPKDSDLERLVELITPSKVKFDTDNDEIMVDMLIRQRKKGPVLRLTLDRINVNMGNLAQLQYLPGLGEELARLGSVAKYLPEDDRPGLLTLGVVRYIDVTVEVGGRFGAVEASLKDLELGHITVPSLFAVAVSTVSVNRNKIEELVGTSQPAAGSAQRPPVVMLRMIDDIEPVLKVKLMGLSIDYRVPTVMDLLGLADDATPQDFEASLAASVANLGDQAHTAMKTGTLPTSSADQQRTSKPIKVDVAFRDCLVGLNPLGLTSKLTVVLTDAHLEATPGKNNTVSAIGNMKKASILLIDDISLASSEEGPLLARRRPSAASSPQVVELCSKGYVDICQISSARAIIKVAKDNSGLQHVDVELRDDLLVMETCADSTQTLIALANALKPPTPPSKEIKYLTSVVPMEDLLASISADAFGKAEGDYEFDTDFAVAQELGGEVGSEDDFYGGYDSGQLELDSQYYEEAAVQEQLFDATASSTLSDGTTTHDTKDGVLLSSNFSAHNLAQDDSDELDIQDDYFGAASVIQGTAHRWDSKADKYTQANDPLVKRSPLRVCVRDVHVIWNLFDGYDWARTRDVITKAVQDVEARAHERRARADRIANFDQDEDEENIGDFLFNSIYISIPSNRDPAQLTQAINQELNDNATETESIATTTMTSTTNRTATPHRSKTKRLRLNRSKHHKITFELKGVNVDLVAFPPDSGETENSIDVRIHDLDIFDHVPTSTWKKFAMYDQDAGEREMGASMVHLEILNTKPVANVAASELVIKVKVLPLRLHVDQDALDFITRFFEFKDDSVPIHASPSDVPFIQRIEIHDVPVTLDFKPKRIDYAGLRSGHTTEFMNIMILEDSRMVLKHVILYGVSGFDKMGKQLNDIWMDNVKRTQLPGILAGLAPVRSLVNAGSGFKDLIEIPIREYRKDGRIVRSIGKGVGAFAKTTGTEVVKLGAKLAIGTQYALQGAEGMLAPNANPYGEGMSSGGGSDLDEDDFPEQKKQISLYADQPVGIVQGVRGAYASLARDLSVARDAIIAVPGEVMESTSAQGAVKAVLKRAPTIIFRPAIGTTRAIGQTLIGATNSIDPANRRRMEAKYKKH